jgi:hypothetical protein
MRSHSQHGVSAFPELMPQRSPGNNRKRRRTSISRCGHVIKVSTAAPHPRYGDRVPYFTESYEPDPNCGC